MRRASQWRSREMRSLQRRTARRMSSLSFRKKSTPSISSRVRSNSLRNFFVNSQEVFLGTKLVCFSPPFPSLLLHITTDSDTCVASFSVWLFPPLLSIMEENNDDDNTEFEDKTVIGFVGAFVWLSIIIAVLSEFIVGTIEAKEDGLAERLLLKQDNLLIFLSQPPLPAPIYLRSQLSSPLPMIDPPPLLTQSSSAPAPPIYRLIPSIPDDIAILCIARVPRSHHPFLAAVSRAWRTFLRSPLFFAVRLDVGASQRFLFINFRTPTDQSRWYVLDRLRRNQSPPLISLPAPPIVSILGCTAVALGHSLFLLGGSLDGIPSSVVQIYDARFNRWRLGARMFASREFAAAGVISGRIYAVGGCLPINEYWAEEFDPETERWTRISSPPEVREKWMHGNAVIGGKLFAMADRGGVAFDPTAAATDALITQEKAWTLVPTSLDLGWRGRAAVVGEVLYSYSYLGKIKGYDFTKDEWRTVEGVDKELPKFLHGATLTNLGELLCLIWEGRRKGKGMEVICAGVRVTKTDTGGLQGSVEWSETFVLAFPKGTSISHCISLEF